MMMNNITLEEISKRLTAAGIEHLCTFQHLMTNKPIVVWERDLSNGCVFIQNTIPAIDGSPEVQNVIAIGHGTMSKT
jgi:hypothetical protein